MGAILVIGPLPPPIHGFSAATETMIGVFRDRGFVQVLNTAGSFTSLAKELYRAIWFVVRERPSAIYVAMSGGYRQLVDLIATAVVRLVAGFLGCELRVCIHHHSFRYLDKKSTLAALMFFASGRRARHIALCETMACRLLEVYDISEANLHVLSNSILVDDKMARSHIQNGEQGPPSDRVVLGYLSNLTEEKGVFTFLDLCARLKQEGQPVETVVAGPLAPDIAARFRVALEAAGGRHLGPVYGEGKADFFASIDALVFPTRYKNEAEPLVIWEGFSFSVPVLSYARGCICSIVPSDCGHIVDPQACHDPLSELHATVVSWISDRSCLRTMGDRAREHFELARDASRGQLRRIIDWMFDGK